MCVCVCVCIYVYMRCTVYISVLKLTRVFAACVYVCTWRSLAPRVCMYITMYVCVGSAVELRKAVPTTLSLRNTNSFPVGFKVKTTSPKSYAVKVCHTCTCFSLCCSPLLSTSLVNEWSDERARKFSL